MVADESDRFSQTHLLLFEIVRCLSPVDDCILIEQIDAVGMGSLEIEQAGFDCTFLEIYLVEIVIVGLKNAAVYVKCQQTLPFLSSVTSASSHLPEDINIKHR